jgi:hypothetical protein
MISKQTLLLGQDTVVLPIMVCAIYVNPRMRKTTFQCCGTGFGIHVINRPTGSGFVILNNGSGSLIIINDLKRFQKKFNILNT